jgi:hypothetical protein
MKNGFSASCAWTGETKTRAALSQKTKPLLRPDRSSKNKICKGRQEIEKQPSEKPAVTTISKKTLKENGELGTGTERSFSFHGAEHGNRDNKENEPPTLFESGRKIAASAPRTEI